MILSPSKGINKYIHVKSSIKQKNYQSKNHKYKKNPHIQCQEIRVGDTDFCKHNVTFLQT